MHSTDISFLNLRDIVPAGAESCAVALRPADSNRIDARFPGVRFPESLSRAVPRRRLHYAAGRHCARAAMAQLGLCSDDELTRDAHNVPVWPAGVVGSISHTDDLAWAAVARVDGMFGVGVDVEQVMDAPRAARLERTICGPDEIELAAASGLGRPEFLTLAFSFKESLYKCVFPLVRRFFWYRDARVIDIDVVHHSIRARLETTLSETFTAGTVFSGRFAFSDRHVFTSLFLPRSAS